MISAPATAARNDRMFLFGVTSAALIGAAIRFAYDIRDTRAHLGGDGGAYRVISLRLADGFGYTLPGPLMSPFTSHPPGWVSILGAFAWLGARSLLSQQLLGAVIGVVLIVLTGVVARRAFGRRVGVIAAVLAAIYPGFWVLEGNVLSEPLVLVLIAVLTLVVFGLRDTPTLQRAAACGALCGLIGLVRSEDVALLLVVVVPVVLSCSDQCMWRRVALLGVAGAGCLLVVLPWTAYTASRYHEPVFLSNELRRAAPRRQLPAHDVLRPETRVVDDELWARVQPSASDREGNHPRSRAARARGAQRAPQPRQDARRRPGPIRSLVRRVPSVADGLVRCDVDGNWHRADLGVGHLLLAPPALGDRGRGARAQGAAVPASVPRTLAARRARGCDRIRRTSLSHAH